MASQLPRYEAMLEGVASEPSIETKISMLGAFQETVHTMGMSDAISVLNTLDKMLQGGTSAADLLGVCLKSEVLATMAVIHTLLDFPHRKHDVFCDFVDRCFSFITKSNDDTNIQLRSCAAMCLLELELAYPGIFIKETTIISSIAQRERTSAVSAYASLAAAMVTSAVKVTSRRSRVEPASITQERDADFFSSAGMSYKYKLPATYLSYPLQLKPPSASENVVTGAMPYKSSLLDLIQLLPNVALSVSVSLASAVLITSKCLGIDRQHVHRVFSYISRGLVSGKTVTGNNLESLAVAGTCRHVMPQFLADSGATLMIQLGLLDPLAPTIHQYIQFRWRRQLSHAIAANSNDVIDDNSLLSPLRMGGVACLYHPAVVFEAIAAAPTAVRDVSHVAELISPIAIVLSRYKKRNHNSDLMVQELFMKPWYEWIRFSQYCGGRDAVIQILVNLILHRVEDNLITSAVHRVLQMFKDDNCEHWVHGELSLVLLRTAISRNHTGLGNMLEFVAKYLEWSTSPSRCEVEEESAFSQVSEATPLTICDSLCHWMKVRTRPTWKEDNAVLNMMEVAIKQAKFSLKNQLCSCTADLIQHFSSTSVKLQAVMFVNEITTGSLKRLSEPVQLQDTIGCSDRYCPDNHLCQYGYISEEYVECSVCLKKVDPFTVFWCTENHGESLPSTSNSSSLAASQTRRSSKSVEKLTTPKNAFFECLQCAQAAELLQGTNVWSTVKPPGLSLTRNGVAKAISKNSNGDVNMQLALNLSLNSDDPNDEIFGITITFKTQTPTDAITYSTPTNVMGDDLPTLHISVLKSGNTAPLLLDIVQKQPLDVLLCPVIRFTSILKSEEWREVEVPLPELRVAALDCLLEYESDKDLKLVFNELIEESQGLQKSDWLVSRTNILVDARERLIVLDRFRVDSSENDGLSTSCYLINTAGGHTLLIESVATEDAATLTVRSNFWLSLSLIDSLFGSASLADAGVSSAVEEPQRTDTS
eukprot:TRINITY_DN6010_c0_g1_i1.p1 TRINITY_DN6010_c0_g1~~TRINITY_DN6010_c0_g1_i1.p1  ORF type:complete len:988 (+),score=164.63 TRINITY_DN6010_c0_g1_i1:86-3049(+)